ncbi:ABC transporter [Thalassotalea sp. HSM 43]|uniref:ABC transporter permease n=1 Tax=Thalassotalea sp. HSM 43 TaxID=2552945 RepID=UPI001080B9DA|nr:ABC transporter permease [Thalassotalea sp. HSM 43]QBY03356.1 ABC transporter [Thalassotalea sp. HSM 43]
MAEVRRRSNLQIWQDVIFAIFLREIRSKFNDKVGISWALINPLLFVFAFSFIRSQLAGPTTHSMPTVIFIMYGMLMIQLFLSTFRSVSGSVQKNKALFAFRQVQPISAVLANAMFELLVIFAVILVTMLLIYLIGIEFYIYNPLLVISYVVLVWLISVALGLLFAVAKAFVAEIGKLENLLLRPMFFISGIFFSLKDIPQQYWPYLDWNPFLHAVELSRDAAYPTFAAKGVSVEFLLMFALTTLFLSLAVYKAFWKQVVSR